MRALNSQFDWSKDTVLIGQHRAALCRAVQLHLGGKSPIGENRTQELIFIRAGSDGRNTVQAGSSVQRQAVCATPL